MMNQLRKKKPFFRARDCSEKRNAGKPRVPLVAESPVRRKAEDPIKNKQEFYDSF
jgi:hypothetical protein